MAYNVRGSKKGENYYIVFLIRMAFFIIMISNFGYS